jgi:hypothetical protein
MTKRRASRRLSKSAPTAKATRKVRQLQTHRCAMRVPAARSATRTMPTVAPITAPPIARRGKGSLRGRHRQTRSVRLVGRASTPPTRTALRAPTTRVRQGRSSQVLPTKRKCARPPAWRESTRTVDASIASLGSTQQPPTCQAARASSVSRVNLVRLLRHHRVPPRATTVEPVILRISSDRPCVSRTRRPSVARVSDTPRARQSRTMPRAIHALREHGTTPTTRPDARRRAY